jgi:hypothetical protein
MSILSGSTDFLELFTKSIAGYPSDPRDGSFMQNLAQAHLDVGNLEKWLRGGTSPLALEGLIGALLSLSSIEPATKEQLGHVRAILHHIISGETPLLAACRAGHFDLGKLLIEKGADVKMGNNQGETPLLAACRAGHFDLCALLVDKGADVRAAQRDGVTPLAMSILSGSTDFLELFTKSIAGYPSDPRDGSFMQNLAQAYLDWRKLEAWLRGGTSPLALKGHIGALLSLSSIEPATKEQLGHVRAFLDRNEALLEKSPSEWPVAHTVLQLVSQEPEKVFAHAHSAPGDEDTSPATRPPLIYWRNKPAFRRCRLTMRARAGVQSVSYSKCGRKLARAEGNKVVVCDAETGFVESTLTGHRYVPSPCIECLLL